MLPEPTPPNPQGPQSSQRREDKEPENIDKSPSAPPESRIDLQALAEKVYALMKKELRIERDRSS